MVSGRIFQLSVVVLAATTCPESVVGFSSVHQRHSPPQRTAAHVLRMSDGTADTASDPFEAYQLTASQTLAIKDTVVGTGAAVESGNLLTLKYTARFMENGKEFDKSDSYVCRVGKGKILPGFDEGLMDMKVGGARIIRIPPSLAYGDQWFKGVIPPNSHLEFECELQSIAQSPQEEFMVQLQDFGVARAVGLILTGGYLAISPMLG